MLTASPEDPSYLVVVGRSPLTSLFSFKIQHVSIYILAFSERTRVREGHGLDLFRLD